MASVTSLAFRDVRRSLLRVPARAVCIAALALLAPMAESAAPGTPRFNRDIRPILSENCFRCHGFDAAARQAKLRLDVRESAVERGAIVPGKPEESELLQRIFHSDPNELMPPPDSHKKLTAAQKELLRKWIAAGAEYESHWAYLPVVRPSVPAGRTVPPGATQPIDAFILDALRTRGLDPAPPADARTLLRRLSLDLIGLPPTPEEMAAFLKDRTAMAWTRQVDRLLASPHFGERMAVPWLDVVRFADTVGYHGDQNHNVFPYRDYVIDAFNRNKPFDRFTIEQLAGDLLPAPADEQFIATAFNRLNMVTREGGAQPGEYLAKYAADRVRTVSTAWLGSTMACAECHDHKFDPFTMRDFYSMAAFFADIRQWGVYNDYKYTPNPDLKGWSNDHPFPPERFVESPYLQQRQATLRRRMEELFAAAAAGPARKSRKPAPLEAWRDDSLRFLRGHPDGWRSVSPVSARPGGTNVTAVITNGLVLLAGRTTEGGDCRIKLPPLSGWVGALRVELVPHASHKGSSLRNGARNTTLTLSASRKDAAGKETRLDFLHADADPKQARYVNGHELPGITAGWRTVSGRQDQVQSGVWLLDPPVRLSSNDTLHVTLKSDHLGAARVSVTPFPALRPLESGARAGLREALQAGPGRRSPAQQHLLEEAFFLGTAGTEEARAEFKSVHDGWLQCRDGRVPVVVTEAWEPRRTRVLPRGNWMDESGEEVAPAPPGFLPRPAGQGRLTRLDLAQWLVSRENPLTARVFVNRLWKQFFGAGLSDKLDDLGAQGETPSHPELLDWLAAEFMDRGWDVKHVVRLIVISQTYRQDSKGRPELRELDPANRLLARQQPRRLDAEFVRDNALFAAGLLNLDVGGPSAFPYQPAGYYVNLQFPKRDYVDDRDDRQYRRGVYAHWQRTFLHPMLANFDAPAREECSADRTVSNTPQQALTLLNDPTFVEAARVLAARLLRGSKAANDTTRLNLAFEHALGRPAREAERASLESFLTAQRAHFGASPEDAAKLLRVGFSPAAEGAASELAAWTSVCRVILNLQETVTRY